MSTFCHAQQCFERHLSRCIRQGSALPCISRCLFMHLHQCMPGASVGKPVQSAVLCCPHARVSFVFVIAHSIFERSFWVAPHPLLAFLPLYIHYISVTGARLLSCVGLMAGLPGFASHGSGLIYELAAKSGSSWMSGTLNLCSAMLLLIEQ